MDENKEVETVENGARKVFFVTFDLGAATGAGVGGVAKIATRTGVHGSNEHKIGGVGSVVVGAGDGDRMVFERATE